MTPRFNPMTTTPKLANEYLRFSNAVSGSDLEPSIRHLIEIRASQLNGCAFCLDMHVKQARMHGEGELKVHHIAIWRESNLFSNRERAALAWTELLTRIPEHGVSDRDYDAVRAEFSEQEAATLTFAIMTINGWNRLNVAARGVPGSLDEMLGIAHSGLS